jgi:hypothetical protein
MIQQTILEGNRMKQLPLSAVERCLLIFSLSTGIGFGQQKSAAARIKIDTERTTPPSMQRPTSFHYGPGADWIGWNRTILDSLKGYIDYLSLHRYVGNSDNDYYEFLASSLDLEEKTKIAEGLRRRYLTRLY